MHKSLFWLTFLCMLLCTLQPLVRSNSAQQNAPACCCDPSAKTLCLLGNSIFREVKAVEKQLGMCCSTIEADLDAILKALNACGPVIPISQGDIPLQTSRSGYFCLKEDVFFDGNAFANPGIEGPIGLAFRGNNVTLDLNNHTIRFSGNSANAIAVFAKLAGAVAGAAIGADPDPRASTHMTIKNGTLIGSGDSFQTGILILTNNVTVSNVRIINASGPSSSGIVIQGALLPDVHAKTVIFSTLNDVLIDRCNLVNNNYGIQLNTFTNSVTIQDTSIDASVQMGITQPSRKNIASNVTINRVTISNSGLNGIYTTFNQANWVVKNCQVSNSGLNGMIFEAFQNLKISNTQVHNSGAHGIVASIRQSQNIDMSNTQIFNAQDATLRVDNVANLLITKCEFTNYIATSSPVVKLQDIFNGTVSLCQFNSVAGTSDGLFLRNVHGVTVEKSKANIFCNQPRTNCPVGFNIHGGVDTTALRHCMVSGNPSNGIAIVGDPLNGINKGVIVEDCIVQGAAGDGIFIDAQSFQSSIMNNKVSNNTGFGINNLGVQSSIFHNFASANGAGNYNGIPANLIATPDAHVGVLENISN